MTAPTQQQVDPTLVAALALSGAAQITANVSAATTRMITALWLRINPYNPRQVADFAAQAGQLIVASQRSVATSAAAAQLMQLRAVGINQNVAVTIPDNVRGATVTFGRRNVQVHAPATTNITYDTGTGTVPHRDSTPGKLFERAAETYRYERSTGKDTATANTSAEQRIAKLVDSNIMLAQRLAEQQTLASVSHLDNRVIGYRRVIHPELSKGGVCGLCVAASDRMYHIDHLKPVHALCKCGIAPVTKTHDPGHRLNQDDLSNLYDAAGSTAGADLKRTRYDIYQHHELGPVLTRVTGEKVPYYSVQPPAQAA